MPVRPPRLAALAVAALLAPTDARAHGLSFGTGAALLAPAGEGEVPPELAQVAASIAAAEEIAAAAATAAAAPSGRSDAELARRLVAGQVMLRQKDSERAAIVFLDLLENAPDSPAAAQARFYLGEALVLLGMRRWAAECFSRTLADPGPEARRLHQRAVAKLLGLASPAQAPGHARRPGLGATPELRARLQSLGLTSAAPQTPTDPPAGELGPPDVQRLRGWVQAIAPDQRIAELRYAYGRHLFLAREYAAAFAELDALAPVEGPLDARSPDLRWLVRATYVAGASAAALGRLDLAIARFDRLIGTRMLGAADREIRDLAWLARARLYFDQNDPAEALRAYRQVGRDSPLFPEALYETAWALLRAGRHEVALAALELLLAEFPDGAVASEALQLRGKLQVQQRAWKAAEAEFTALRRGFEQKARSLAGALTVEADAAAYYTEVARGEGREFDLAALLPRGAGVYARTMRRAVQAERLARETGEVDQALRETRELLARMEAVAAAPDRPLVFTDLGAHWTSLDAAGFQLAEAGELLLARAGAKLDAAGYARLEGERARRRRDLDTLRTGKSARARKVDDAGAAAAELDGLAAGLRAQLVALERGQLASGKPRTAAFFAEATALRAALAEAEAGAAALRDRLVHGRATLRFTDPLISVRRAELAGYRAFLGAALAAAARAAGDPAVDRLLARLVRADARLAAAARVVAAAADQRLARALVVLREEHDNLARYAAEFTDLRARALTTVGEATAAAVRDVRAELGYWTVRAEVGLLDVAWALQASEQDEAERLERTRDQSYKELDRALDEVMEALE
jgi:TolA-binding protein